MIVKTLYRFEREGGGVTVSPSKPDTEFSVLYRIIADKGKVITKDNISFYSVIDTESAEGWREVDATEGAEAESAE